MAKRLTIQWDGDDDPRIESNDRGKWALLETGAGFTLIGFAFESHIDVLASPMQDGTCDFVVVYRTVDNSMCVVHEKKPWPSRVTAGEFVTAMIHTVYEVGR